MSTPWRLRPNNSWLKLSSRSKFGLFLAPEQPQAKVLLSNLVNHCAHQALR